MSGLVKFTFDAVDKGVSAVTGKISAALKAMGKEADQAGKVSSAAFKDMYSTANGFLAANVIQRITSGFAEFNSASFKLNASLDQNRKMITTLSGSVAEGGRIWKDATAFAEKYGFTQAAISSATKEAMPIFEKTNESTEKTLEVLGRLSTLNSAEGISGATVAFKELISLDPTSMAERFNMGRGPVKAMIEEIKAGKDPVYVLSRALDSMGVSGDVLTQRMDGPNGALLRLEQSTEKASLAYGRFLDTIGVDEVMARAARGLDVVASSLEAFSTVGTKTQDVAGRVLEASASFAEYSQKIQQVNDQIPWYLSGINEMTEAQYNWGQSLMQTGTAADEAALRAGRVGDVLAELKDAENGAAAGSAEVQQAMVLLGDSLLMTASQSPELHDQVVALMDAFQDGTITTDEFRLRVDELYNSIMVAGGGFSGGEWTGAIQEYNTALSDTMQKSLDAETASLELANAQDILTSVSGSVNAGLMDASQAAAILAQQYGITEAAAWGLVRAKAALAGGVSNAIGGSYAPKDASLGGVSDQTARKRAIAARQARQEYEFNQSGKGDQLGMLKRQAATQKANGQLEAYYKTLGRIGGLEDKTGRAGVAGAKKTGDALKKTTDQRAKQAEKLQDKLVEIEQDKAKKIEDINHKLNEKLLDLDRDLTKKKIEAQRQFEAGMRVGGRESELDMSGNDLDLLGASGKQLEALKAREAAEQEYLKRIMQSQEEARKVAEGGDAELAATILAEREAGARAQLELDNAVNAKRQELLDNEQNMTKEQQAAALAALEQHHAEQTDKIKNLENTKTKVAIEEGQIKHQADQQRVDDAIAAANEERDAAIAASEEKRAEIVADLAEMGVAFNDSTLDADAYRAAIEGIPTEITTTIKQVYQNSGAPAAGGGIPDSYAPPGRASGGPVPMGQPFEIFDTPGREKLLFAGQPGGFILSPNQTIEHDKAMQRSGGNITLQATIDARGSNTSEAQFRSWLDKWWNEKGRELERRNKGK